MKKDASLSQGDAEWERHAYSQLVATWDQIPCAICSGPSGPLSEYMERLTRNAWLIGLLTDVAREDDYTSVVVCVESREVAKDGMKSLQNTLKDHRIRAIKYEEKEKILCNGRTIKFVAMDGMRVRDTRGKCVIARNYNDSIRTDPAILEFFLKVVAPASIKLVIYDIVSSIAAPCDSPSSSPAVSIKVEPLDLNAWLKIIVR